MLAYDYPILGLFWTMLILFFWIAWFVIFFQVVIDIFRSDDLSGGGKALWAFVVVVLGPIGVLIYLVVRGSGMRERSVEKAKEQREQMDAYVRQAAGTAGGSGGVADEISKLSELHARGALTEEEFQQQKAKLLT